MRRPARSLREPVWWLAEEADCEFCAFGYALCTELRCVACDRAVCRGCVVIVHVAHAPTGARCPECARENTEAD